MAYLNNSGVIPHTTMCCIGRPNKRMQNCWLEKNPDLTGKLYSSCVAIATKIAYLCLFFDHFVARQSDEGGIGNFIGVA